MKDLLASDHSEIDEIISQLFAAFERGVAENIFEKLDLFWARLAMHIRAEHLRLFPAILTASQMQTSENKQIMSYAKARSTIEQLHYDHDFFMKELGLAIKQLRVVCENSSQNNSAQLSEIRDKVSAVCHRLEKHNELEESQVYLWANSLLNPTEYAVLNQQIKKELDNLPPRFQK